MVHPKFIFALFYLVFSPINFFPNTLKDLVPQTFYKYCLNDCGLVSDLKHWLLPCMCNVWIDVAYCRYPVFNFSYILQKWYTDNWQNDIHYKNTNLVLIFYFFFTCRTMLEMRNCAVFMFPQTIYTLVMYFWSAPRMWLGQIYLYGKELVSKLYATLCRNIKAGAWNLPTTFGVTITLSWILSTMAIVDKVHIGCV